MLITPSFQKSLIVEQFQGNYLKLYFSLWNATKEEMTKFIERGDRYHPKIKFTAEISETETSSC